MTEGFRSHSAPKSDTAPMCSLRAVRPELRGGSTTLFSNAGQPSPRFATVRGLPEHGWGGKW